jgi:short-chain fatty acids transporter
VAPAEREDPDAGALPRALERSSWVVWLVAAPALAWLAIQFWASGLSALNLNTANLLFLSLGLALHGSAHSYGRAVEAGARSCAGVIIQFPLYAGVMGMIGGSGLAVALSGFFVELSGGSEAGLSLTTFASAGVVNLFVPSGGGQWAIQGPIGMRAAMDTGADPARIVMAVSYGDQLTNMLQPFWALPLLAITGVRARDIVGYTAVLMVLAGVWIAGCLVLV